MKICNKSNKKYFSKTYAYIMT